MIHTKGNQMEQITDNPLNPIIGQRCNAYMETSCYHISTISW